MLNVERVADKFTKLKEQIEIEQQQIAKAKQMIKTQILEPLEDQCGDDVFFAVENSNAYQVYLMGVLVLTFTFGDNGITYTYDNQPDIYTLTATGDKWEHFQLFYDETDGSDYSGETLHTTEQFAEFILNVVETSMYL